MQTVGNHCSVQIDTSPWPSSQGWSICCSRCCGKPAFRRASGHSRESQGRDWRRGGQQVAGGKAGGGWVQAKKPRLGLRAPSCRPSVRTEAQSGKVTCSGPYRVSGKAGAQDRLLARVTLSDAAAECGHLPRTKGAAELAASQGLLGQPRGARGTVG